MYIYVNMHFNAHIVVELNKKCDLSMKDNSLQVFIIINFLYLFILTLNKKFYFILCMYVCKINKQFFLSYQWITATKTD